MFETETAQLAGLVDGRETTTKEDLPKACDLIVLLGDYVSETKFKGKDLRMPIGALSKAI